MGNAAPLILSVTIQDWPHWRIIGRNFIFAVKKSIFVPISFVSSISAYVYCRVGDVFDGNLMSMDVKLRVFSPYRPFSRYSGLPFVAIDTVLDVLSFSVYYFYDASILVGRLVCFLIPL